MVCNLVTRRLYNCYLHCPSETLKTFLLSMTSILAPPTMDHNFLWCNNNNNKRLQEEGGITSISVPWMHHDAALQEWCFSNWGNKILFEFITSPEICSLLWDCIDPLNTMPNGMQDVHLLWGLMFLKLYVSESVNCALAGGIDEKTFWKWNWMSVYAMSDLAPDIVSINLHLYQVIKQ